MKTRRFIALAEKDQDLGIFMYKAEDLHEELTQVREMVRMLLRSVSDDFDMSVPDVMKRMFVLDWIIENMEMKDTELPKE